MYRIKLTVAATAFTATSLALMAPAAAERAEHSRGVGVCVSQIAIASEDILGLPNLGMAIRELGRNGELAPLLDSSRNSCGEPPGPGHLGG